MHVKINFKYRLDKCSPLMVPILKEDYNNRYVGNNNHISCKSSINDHHNPFHNPYIYNRPIYSNLNVE